MEIILSKKEITRLKTKWVKKCSQIIKNLPDYEFNACANGNKEFEITMKINIETSF